MSINMTSSKREKGFTLTEMITVLAVTSILASAAIPGFSRVVSGTQIDSAASELYAALDTARGEAIVRTSTVSICARSTNTACSGNAGWTNGWLVFVDTDFDGVRDAGEEILLNYETNGEGVDFVDTDTSGQVIFRGDGSVGSNNDIDICGAYNEGIRLEIGAAGRITTRTIEGGTCAS